MSCRWAVSGPGVRVWEATDLIGLFSVSGGGGGGLIGWHCAKVQGHAELERYKVLIGWHCAKVQGHAEL